MPACSAPAMSRASSVDVGSATSTRPPSRRRPAARAAVRALRRGAAVIRKLSRQPAHDVDVEAGRRPVEAERRRLEADLAEARRRRARQTHDRLSEAVVRAGIAH